MNDATDITGFDDLWRAAQSGDAGAQYGLAAYYGQRGRSRRALRWLQSAAEGGSADAQFTLACWYLQGLHVAPDWEKGRALLDRAAENGHAEALCVRATIRVIADGGDAWATSIGDIAAAATGRHAGAIRQIAMLALHAGDKKAARRYLADAAGLGDSIAAWLLQIMRGDLNESGMNAIYTSAPGKPLPLPECAAAASPPRLPLSIPKKLIARLSDPKTGPSPKIEPLSQTPHIAVCRHFMSAEECAYLVALSLPRLVPSQVFDPTSGRAFLDPYRRSSDARFWPLDQDLVVYRLNLRIARLAKLSIENQEMLTVLRYAPGEEYKPHYDFLTDKAELESGGQRIKTVLVYLNTGFEGGETKFPSAEVAFKGDPGDALLFDNVDSEGRPNQDTLHAGTPITAGVKWLASKWIREKPQPLYGRRA